MIDATARLRLPSFFRTGDRCSLCAICSSSNLEAAGGGGGGKCGDEDGIWRGYAELPPVSGMSGLSLPQPGLLGHSSTNYATKTQPDLYLQFNTRDLHLLYLFESDLWSLFIILQPSIYSCIGVCRNICLYFARPPQLPARCCASWEVSNLAQVSLLTRQNFDTN